MSKPNQITEQTALIIIISFSHWNRVNAISSILGNNQVPLCIKPVHYGPV